MGCEASKNREALEVETLSKEGGARGRGKGYRAINNPGVIGEERDKKGADPQKECTCEEIVILGCGLLCCSLKGGG